jgi:predicted nucleic acid-binding protein
MIIDTDVLIWFFRSHEQAITELENIAPGNRFVSIISYMELLQGVRNKAELKELKKLEENIAAIDSSEKTHFVTSHSTYLAEDSYMPQESGLARWTRRSGPVCAPA